MGAQGHQVGAQRVQNASPEGPKGPHESPEGAKWEPREPHGSPEGPKLEPKGSQKAKNREGRNIKTQKVETLKIMKI
jgi:hypothetical protein